MLMFDITGTEFNYYLLCHRKLWLFKHDIHMEHTSDNVFMGRLIDEHSYPRAKKEILIDGVVKIDFMDDGAVHEVKKSNKMEEAHIGQLLYYIYCLRQKGVDIRKGIINYPKLRRTTEVELTPEKETEIAGGLGKIKEIEAMKQPPSVLNAKICKKCGYEDFCYS
ncbi:MAG: CRISPR-associated protein Cas4 [Nitrospirae bacterium]|nr:CRISPR-associated protein Cas4 [Nitrospirota bacterium]